VKKTARATISGSFSFNISTDWASLNQELVLIISHQLKNYKLNTLAFLQLTIEKSIRSPILASFI